MPARPVGALADAGVARPWVTRFAWGHSVKSPRPSIAQAAIVPRVVRRRIFDSVDRQRRQLRGECAAGRRSTRRIAAGSRDSCGRGPGAAAAPAEPRLQDSRPRRGHLRFLLGNQLDPTRRRHLPDESQELGLHDSRVVSLVDRGGEPVNEVLELQPTPTLSIPRRHRSQSGMRRPKGGPADRCRVASDGRPNATSGFSRQASPSCGFFGLPGCVRGRSLTDRAARAPRNRSVRA